MGAKTAKLEISETALKTAKAAAARLEPESLGGLQTLMGKSPREFLVPTPRGPRLQSRSSWWESTEPVATIGRCLCSCLGLLTKNEACCARGKKLAPWQDGHAFALARSVPCVAMQWRNDCFAVGAPALTQQKSTAPDQIFPKLPLPRSGADRAWTVLLLQNVRAHCCRHVRGKMHQGALRQRKAMGKRPAFERIALLLQGGGALGSYQGGVYQALSEADLYPDWVAGISIGAVNSALIAGNAPGDGLKDSDSSGKRSVRRRWVFPTTPPSTSRTRSRIRL